MSRFGIEVGDIVTTSYGTGPYIVTSVVRTANGHSLAMKGAPGSIYAGGHRMYCINQLFERDGKFVTVTGHEVYVAKPIVTASFKQPSLFATENGP